jgi:hypothetical protein
VPQSSAKENFYCTIYYIILNSNCEAERASKIKKNAKVGVTSQN